MSTKFVLIIFLFIAISDTLTLRKWCYNLADNHIVQNLKYEECDNLCDYFTEITDLNGATDDNLYNALKTRDAEKIESFRKQIDAALKARKAEQIRAKKVFSRMTYHISANLSSTNNTT